MLDTGSKEETILIEPLKVMQMMSCAALTNPEVSAA